MNFVRSVVESQNSIFQEINTENDIGNDAYIEFVDDESGTGCCVACQIKSGISYTRMTDSGKEFVLKADRDHFEYWSSHILPVVGIVYDPTDSSAAWINISSLLDHEPNRLTNGPYDIRIPRHQTFSNVTFDSFKKQLLLYSERYRSRDALAYCVESFLEDSYPEQASAALRSLFNYHRNTKACWLVILTSLSYCSSPVLLKKLTQYIALIPGHPDICWHDKNLIDPLIRTWALDHIKRYFNKRDFESLISVIDPEEGIDRGTDGQNVHAIVSCIPNKKDLLTQIFRDHNIKEEIRWFALIILLYEVQMQDPKMALEILKLYQFENPKTEYSSQIYEIKTQLIEEHCFYLY